MKFNCSLGNSHWKWHTYQIDQVCTSQIYQFRINWHTFLWFFPPSESPLLYSESENDLSLPITLIRRPGKYSYQQKAQDWDPFPYNCRVCRCADVFTESWSSPQLTRRLLQQMQLWANCSGGGDDGETSEVIFNLTDLGINSSGTWQSYYIFVIIWTEVFFWTQLILIPKEKIVSENTTW